VAVWTLQALVERYDVGVLLWQVPDWDSVNRFFGTHVDENHVSVYQLPVSTRRWIGRIPGNHALLGLSAMARYSRRLQKKHGYHLVISTANEVDFGSRGIQYIHFPAAQLPRPDLELRWYHQIWGVMSAYRMLCRWVEGRRTERVRGNLTLCNSDYIGRMFQSLYKSTVQTLYPPVHGNFPHIPWDQRQNGFVCISRISPEKALVEIITTVEQVRDKGWDIKLHVVGTAGPGKYADSIRGLVHKHTSWIRLHEGLTRQELVQLVATQRYGIHAMRGEHFGMAVAEMQRAGCITFAHNSGGPVEILAGDERLLYDDPAQAVVKIDAVLSDDASQRMLNQQALERGGHFSADSFMCGMRAAVQQCLREENKPMAINTAPTDTAQSIEPDVNV